jgi:hypothetical protein
MRYVLFGLCFWASACALSVPADFTRGEAPLDASDAAVGVPIEASVEAAMDAPAEPAITCGAGQVLCGDQCATLRYDPRHCGACGQACRADQRCADGQCRCPAPTDECETLEARACVHFANDPAHCGGCGRACPQHQLCSNGGCVPTCTAPQVACGRACVDLSTQPDHCGMCGHRCGSDAVCVAGGCECREGFGDCDGSPGCETDLRTDWDHCGACGRACPSGATCVGGTCRCTEGLLSCLERRDASVPALVCVAMMGSDRLHCGACGRACASAEVCCDGRCVNLSSDPGHCGACRHACRAPAPTCRERVCAQ